MRIANAHMSQEPTYWEKETNEENTLHTSLMVWMVVGKDGAVETHMYEFEYK